MRWLLSSALVFLWAACETGAPCDACDASERCVRELCMAPCMPPPLPLFSDIPVGLELGLPGVSLNGVERLRLDEVGTADVVARWQDVAPHCGEASELRAAYAVVAEAPSCGEDPVGARCVSREDAGIAMWASRVVSYAPGEDLDPGWSTPDKALGPSSGQTEDVVSLGNGGEIVLAFERPFCDGPGVDFAVFENGFSEAFLELAFVEVSSDGVHYARFPSLSAQASPIGPYGQVLPETLRGLAGVYPMPWGGGFELSDLRHQPEVQLGLVDLQAIRYLRVVDIVGDGDTHDSFGHPIYDPTPTHGPAGFDLSGVAVMASALSACE